MDSSPEHAVGVVLPHQLGKMCLALRLLRAARPCFGASTRVFAFAPDACLGGLARLGLFDAMAAYDDTAVRRFGVLLDMSSYPYSYAIAARSRWERYVCRDPDLPWKIHVHTPGGSACVHCPVLAPDTGWFARDSTATAMACELPIVNLALQRAPEETSLLDAAAHGVISVDDAPPRTRDILFLMGGASAVKHFPLGAWRELGRQLAAEGRAVSAVIGPAEGWLADALLAAGMPFEVTQRLEDLLPRIMRSAAVVANDCGPMHVALMLGHPTLAVFGPTIPEAWFCPSTEAQVAVQCRSAVPHRSDVLTADAWAHWPSPRQVGAQLADVLGRATTADPSAPIRYLDP